MALTLVFLCTILWFEGTLSQTTSNNNENIISQCATRQEVQAIQNDIQSTKTQLRSDVQSLANQLQSLLRIGSFQNPAQSCRDLQGSSSNYYWILNTKTGIPTRQYCDMTRRCQCTSARGWMQVANLDMTDSNQHCPSGFREITSPRQMCGRHNIGCVSATFPVHGVEYSRVCGRVIGYQYASPDAFAPYYGTGRSIDGNYVDGVSVTHGRHPRKHIWTFAAAVDENDSNQYRCPCSNRYHTFTGRVPPYIGNDYFCETGSRSRFTSRYYVEDPLWNGRGCGSVSTCCSFNNPPWFCKQLPQSSTDDIEVRLCGNENTGNEDTPLEIIELYVQ